MRKTEKHILVVDDDSAVRKSLEKLLTGTGYQVALATDGDSAESELAQADLLVLDLNMPIRDGWDVLDQVNADYPLLPVIVISGMADQLEERTIPGASAFLEKPIEVPLLLSTVDRLLKQTHKERLDECSQTSEPWQFPARSVEDRFRKNYRKSQRIPL